MAATTEHEEFSSACLAALESRARRPPHSGPGGPSEAPEEPLRPLPGLFTRFGLPEVLS